MFRHGDMKDEKICNDGHVFMAIIQALSVSVTAEGAFLLYFLDKEDAKNDKKHGKWHC